MNSNLLGGRLRADPAQVAAVRAWTRTGLSLDEETQVVVTQLQCLEPDCPPIETVIAVRRADGGIDQYKIHRPVDEVAEQDVLNLLAAPEPNDHHDDHEEVQ